MGRPGFTLGVGPSHESNISGIYGLSYDHPGPQHRGVRPHPHRPAARRGRGVRGRGLDGAHTGGVVSSPPRPGAPVRAVTPATARRRRARRWRGAVDGDRGGDRGAHRSRITSAPRRRGGQRHGSSPASRWPCTTTGTRRAGPWPPVPSSTPTGRTTSASWSRAGERTLTPPSSATERRSRRNSSPCSAQARPRSASGRVGRDTGLPEASHGSPTAGHVMSVIPAWSEPRTAIVTGGGSGIGLAISKRRRAPKRRPCVLDRDGGAAWRLAIEGRRAGDRPDRRRTDRPGIGAAVTEVRDVLGAATILVNNAGVAVRGSSSRSARSRTSESWP